MRYLLIFLICLPCRAQDTLDVDLSAWDRFPKMAVGNGEVWEMRMHPQTDGICFQKFALFPNRLEPRRAYLKTGGICYTARFREYPGPILLFRRETCTDFNSVFRQFTDIVRGRKI